MFRENVVQIMKDELSRHLTLEIKQLRTDHLVIQLKYRDKDIGQVYEVQTELGYYTDHGHGGGSYADKIKLNIKKIV